MSASGPNFPTQVQPPKVAPTVGQVVAGALGARNYFTRVTYVNILGESSPGPEAGPSAISLNNVATVQSPPAATSSPVAANPATGWNVYVSTTAGTETKQNGGTPIAIGSPWQEPNTGLVVGVALPVQNNTVTAGKYATDRKGQWTR